MLSLATRRKRAVSPKPGRRTLRQRTSEVVERLPQRDRLVLALLLVDRLTLAEAVEVLGITAVELDLTYRRVLAGLRRLAIRSGFDPFDLATRRAAAAEPRLRKAS